MFDEDGMEGVDNLPCYVGHDQRNIFLCRDEEIDRSLDFGEENTSDGMDILGFNADEDDGLTIKEREEVIKDLSGPELVDYLFSGEE